MVLNLMVSEVCSWVGTVLKWVLAPKPEQSFMYIQGLSVTFGCEFEGSGPKKYPIPNKCNCSSIGMYIKQHFNKNLNSCFFNLKSALQLYITSICNIFKGSVPAVCNGG